MGYYIDYVFDDTSVSAWQEVVAKLENAGADVITAAEKEYADRFEDLLHPEIPGMIRVFKTLPENLSGHWADIRLSWGQDPREMRGIIKAILDLADSLGCRVYDGQIQQYVTIQNIDDVMAQFRRTASWVVGMFGAASDSDNGADDEEVNGIIERAAAQKKESLDLCYLNMRRLPSAIGDLDSLKKLMLMGNQLSSLPSEICQLKRLEILDLSKNLFHSIPIAICSLPELKTLNLRSNDFVMLGPEIGQITSLESLDLMRNRLESICPEIGHLKNL
jgi:hypothetical protein